jgi:hypothetical protein
MAETATLEKPDVETSTPENAGSTPRFSIHPLNAGKKSLYEDAVLSLIDAQDHAELDPATGKPEILAITVFVPGEKKAQTRHIRDFRDAATAHNRTARIRSQSDNEDGSVSIEFTLTEKVTRERKAKPTV